MRKLFAIIALCCLFFITAGYHFFFRFRIAEAKVGMRQELLQTRMAEATRLVLSQNEIASLDWESPSEFHFNGEMYDLLKMEKRGGKIIIWCLSDKKETSLVDQYLKVQKQSSEKNSSNAILRLLAIQFIPSTGITLAIPMQEITFLYNCYLLSIPLSEQGILTPPPKVC